MINDAELEDLKTVFVDDYEKYIEMGCQQLNKKLFKNIKK